MAVVDDEAVAALLRERFDRSVSCTPGAEGAPSDGAVEVGWEDAGAMRSAWRWC